MDEDPPFLFRVWLPVTHSCCSAVGKLPQNCKNTDTDVSATVHFLFMLIFPVGNLVHII